MGTSHSDPLIVRKNSLRTTGYNHNQLIISTADSTINPRTATATVNRAHGDLKALPAPPNQQGVKAISDIPDRCETRVMNYPNTSTSNSSQVSGCYY